MVTDCGSVSNPRYPDSSWAHRDASVNEVAFMQVLPDYIFSGCRILHIGVGNSALARKFAHMVDQIDGVTVVREEIIAAPKIENYSVRLVNKYGAAFYQKKNYDVILDGDPTCYACCKKHLEYYLINALVMLTTGGVILLNSVGLAESRKGLGDGFTPAEFAEFIRPLGATLRMVNETVIEVSNA